MKLKDLYCREYKGKDCTAFQYRIVDYDTKKITRFQFDRGLDQNGNPTTFWTVSVVVGDFSGQFRHLFELPFETHNKNIPLEKVCKTGLYVVNMNLIEITSAMSQLTATLSEELNA